MAKGMAAKMPEIAPRLNSLLPAQPFSTKLLKLKPGATTPHEHQQLDHREDGDHQLEGGGDADPDDIQAHEDDVGAHGGELGIKAGKLHVEVGADGHGDRRRSEDKLDQRGQAGDQSAAFAKGPPAVGEGAAGIEWQWSVR